jgi:hypothetical protein
MAAMSWTCGACGHANGDVLVCDACGVARRHLDDPPLDLPRAPTWGEVGAAYLAAMWALLAFGGFVVATAPGLIDRIGVAPIWVWAEVLLASAAAWSSLVQAVWTKRFHTAELSVPRGLRAALPFEASFLLVPFEKTEGVTVTFELVDRYVETVRHRGRSQLRTRQRVLERVRFEAGRPLGGRRRHRFDATFTAPLPSERHSNIQAELAASLAGFLAPIVPGLGHYARNLRAHGGYYVRARVRVGFWQRTFEEQVVSVAVPVGRGQVPAATPVAASASAAAAPGSAAPGSAAPGSAAPNSAADGAADTPQPLSVEAVNPSGSQP